MFQVCLSAFYIKQSSAVEGSRRHGLLNLAQSILKFEHDGTITTPPSVAN
jgi:hypothetical protein